MIAKLLLFPGVRRERLDALELTPDCIADALEEQARLIASLERRRDRRAAAERAAAPSDVAQD